MKKLRVISFLILLGAFPFLINAQSLLSTPQVSPGDILTAIVYQGAMDDVIRFTLLDEKGRVESDAPGLPLELEDVSGNSFIGLLGLSSDLKPGQYKLKAEIRNSGGYTVYERPVLLRSRDFRSEEIPLDQDMSSLRTDDSPERRDQSRQLWALLNKHSEGTIRPEGVLLSPVKEFITSSWYGDRRTYLYNDGGKAFSIHTGLDMAARTGSEIIAPLGGRVVMAEKRILTGWTVVLEHMPGVYSLYYHMDRIDVHMGEDVSQGQLMGTVGSTGLVTGPHLHWELRVNTIAVDPERYLTQPLIDKSGILAIINDTKERGR